MKISNDFNFRRIEGALAKINAELDLKCGGVQVEFYKGGHVCSFCGEPVRLAWRCFEMYKSVSQYHVDCFLEFCTKDKNVTYYSKIAYQVCKKYQIELNKLSVWLQI